MKLWKSLVVFIIYVAALASLTAQTQKMPPNPIPPAASAQICGNLVINTASKTSIFELLQSEGCAVTHFVDLGDDYWLAYGVKVVIELP